MSTPILPPKSSRRAIILGGRSWIGYRLANQLCSQGWSVLCTTSATDFTSINQIGAHKELIQYVSLVSASDLVELIKREQPELVINLLIGIKNSDFELNQDAAKAAEKMGAHFVYASSALALDAYQNEPLIESLPPRSISDYGIFKGRCEVDLQARQDLSSLVLRFSSVHGYSPWKDSRTVALLKKAASGETVKVSQGVIQNRCTDRKLVESICALVEAKVTGVAHIGTSDSSEEFEFLKRLAMAFGFDGENIVLDEKRAINLAVIPGLGTHPDGAIFESDTLAELVATKDLAIFKCSI